MKINPNHVILPKMPEMPVAAGTIPAEGMPVIDIPEEGITGSGPFENPPTDEQKAELSSLVDKLASQNSMNIVVDGDNL